ncbi:MAG: hypothetical protein IK077_14935 [Thermoguttaceae bacterium]|nr:hypothetical protein [Thermoguttaceae bacterium]
MKYALSAYVLSHPVDKSRAEGFYESWKKARNAYFCEDVSYNPIPNLYEVVGMFSERFPRVPNWRAGSSKNRLGHTACYWGHEMMWRKALAENNDDFDDGAAIFFEDDCRFDPNFWEVAFQAYDELPDDWDILYFGGQHCIHGRPRPKDYSPTLYKIENVNRLHAYSVRISSLPKLILWFSENHDWGHNYRDPKTGESEAEVDYAIGSLTETGFLNGYALKNWTAYQGKSFSWTQGRQEEDRRWSL